MKHLLFSLILIPLCAAETRYIRPDGGTAGQCKGSVNSPYPGSGENLDCAWAHPFWALDASGRWKIRGGDTLVIEPGSYGLGYGAPNTGWCFREGAFDCVLPPLPSGPDAENPTRVLGASWDSGCGAAPELWGTQRANTVLDLTGTANARLECLEITDHSSCAEYHADDSIRCQRDVYPYGEWAAMGIYARDSSNVVLRRVNIHGLAETGIRAGRIRDWTVEDVRIAGNGLAGWDGDLGDQDSSNSGRLLFRRWKVEWNGCPETWPERQPAGCWAQEAGGYGDGVGTAASAGHWIIEDSVFRHNTSDGLDLLYLETVRGEQPNVEIRRTIAIGNAGNQIKVAGNSSIVNTIAVGNCYFFMDKPFGRHMGGLESADNCRALGSAMSLFMHRGTRAYLINSTVAGHGDGLFTLECRTHEDEAPECDGSEQISIQNNILVGYGDLRQDEEAALIWDPFGFAKNRLDYNIIHNLKGTPCGEVTHNICADPLFVDPAMETFDGRLREGSPAIDTGLGVGSMDGIVPTEDYVGATRPAGTGVDRGAFEFGAQRPAGTPQP